MSLPLKFKVTTEPINDTITGEEINNGYQLFVPFEIFQKHRFNTKMNLYCPTCDFLRKPMMLHAWTISKNGEFIKKETQESSDYWFNSMNFKQPTAMHWPDIDQAAIEEFGYDVLLVVQPLVDSDIHEIHLELKERFQ